MAGQHVDVRLTAPDGYQAQRSYSIASAPDGDGTIELMIEGLPDGEVSGFFDEVAEVGDTIELRGPIGGAFVWRPEDGGPAAPGRRRLGRGAAAGDAAPPGGGGARGAGAPALLGARSAARPSPPRSWPRAPATSRTFS